MMMGIMGMGVDASPEHVAYCNSGINGYLSAGCWDLVRDASNSQWVAPSPSTPDISMTIRAQASPAAGFDASGNACTPGWDSGCTPVGLVDEPIGTYYEVPDHFLTPDSPASKSGATWVILGISAFIALSFMGGRRR